MEFTLRECEAFFPTVTYPSHTTLMTGVWPSKHGIIANTTFDPTNKNQGGWYWYAEDIHVPTLWQAASKGGYTVGSVSWPVTVGAPGISWNVPEYWRASTPEDLKLMRVLATPGLMKELERTRDLTRRIWRQLYQAIGREPAMRRR